MELELLARAGTKRGFCPKSVVGVSVVINSWKTTQQRAPSGGEHGNTSINHSRNLFLRNYQT